MRVLMTCFPERSHFQQLVPLAWALRTAGHDVRVAAQPDFVDTVTAAGLTAAPINSRDRLWELMMRIPSWLSHEPGLLAPYNVVERKASQVDVQTMAADYARQIDRWHKVSNHELAGELVSIARSWQPDLVVWETYTFAGAVAAKAVGAAHARVVVGPDVVGAARSIFRILKDNDPQDVGDPLRDWLGGYGPEWDFEFSEDMVVGQATVSTVPPALRLAMGPPALQMQYVPFLGDEHIPRWVRDLDDAPRCVLTGGLTRFDRGMYLDGMDQSPLFAGLASTGLDVIATIDPATLPEDALPDGVRAVGFAPLTALLRKTSVVVHHGGYGTAMTAILAGVPQVVIPNDDDEPLIASRLAAAGVAVVLPPEDLTAEAVAEAVAAANTDSMRQAAAALRDQVEAMPGVPAVAEQLEQLVAKHRTRAARNADRRAAVGSDAVV